MFYVHAKSLQSCSTLCNPMDYSPPSSSVHGILQARILEWVALLSSRGSSQPRDEPGSLISPALAGGFFTTQHRGSPNVSTAAAAAKLLQSCLTLCDPIDGCCLLLLSHFSCVRLCVTPETAAHQTPPCMGFARQEHWRGLPGWGCTGTEMHHRAVLC